MSNSALKHLFIISTRVVIYTSGVLLYRLVGMALTAAMGVLLLFLGCAIRFPSEIQ